MTERHTQVTDTGPWPPPEPRHLRTHRYRERDEMVEHWIWEPTGFYWRLQSTQPDGVT